MAIWAEIKKSINSDLSKPLDKLLGTSTDNKSISEKLDEIKEKTTSIKSNLSK